MHFAPELRLAQYHLRPEAKFLNGEHTDRGCTRRRHIIASRILHIGKEANKWEEQHFLGEDEEAEIEFGVDRTACDIAARIRNLCSAVGERATAQNLGISRTALRRALRVGEQGMRGSLLNQLRSMTG